MYAELPIISASNIESDPAVISNAGLQVNPESPEEIAEGILRMYNLDSKERKEIGLRGKAYLLRNKTYERISERYIQLIKNEANG